MNDHNNVSLMYSGGLDSLIAYHYALHNGLTPICINVNFGHDYQSKEVNAIGLTDQKYKPEIHYINIDGIWPLIQKRLTNQIIPSRNVLLSVIGSMVSPRVWINALDGEQNGKEHDKSERFFNDTSTLLSYTNSFFQPNTIVESPFKELTKGEVIKWAIDNNIPNLVLFNTSSCYHPTELKCGKCVTCVKRYIAFLENNINEPGYSFNPLDSEYFKEIKAGIIKANQDKDYQRFTPKRIQSFLTFLEKYGK